MAGYDLTNFHSAKPLEKYYYNLTLPFFISHAHHSKYIVCMLQQVYIILVCVKVHKAPLRKSLKPTTVDCKNRITKFECCFFRKPLTFLLCTS